MFCKNCGKEMPDGTLFCVECGAAMGNTQSQDAPPPPPVQQQFTQQQYPQYQQYQQPFNQQAGTTADNTKLFSILSYIGPLFIIGLIAEPKNEKLKFHVNQGCVLFIADIIVQIVAGILNNILWHISYSSIMSLLTGLISTVAGLGLLVFAIMGIMSAAKGEEKELPIIGQIKIIK